MLKYTAKAKRLLEEENHFLVLCKGEKLITSDSQSIDALFDLLKEHHSFKGYCCSYKNVCRSSALLFAKAQIREIYCQALSSNGRTILAKNGISVYYHTLTDLDLSSSAKADMLEKAVESVTNPDCGYKIIEKLLSADKLNL